MFEIQFFNYTHGKEVVDKTKYLTTQPLILRGTLREETSIVNPDILVESSVIDYNYCYIPIFNRYYYITNISSFTNNLWKISLHVDVLNSYKNGIYFMPCCVTRNETKYNKIIADERRPMKYVSLENRNFDTGSYVKSLFVEQPWSVVVSGYALGLTPLSNDND